MWHHTLLFCSITSRTQGLVILNAELCNPSVCVWVLTYVSVFFFCFFLVFVQTFAYYAEFFLLAVLFVWVSITNEITFLGVFCLLYFINHSIILIINNLTLKNQHES